MKKILAVFLAITVLAASGASVSAAGRGHGAGGAGCRGAGTGGGAPLPRAARGFHASLTKTDGKITENTSIFEDDPLYLS